MNPVEIIEKKRDGKELRSAEIEAFVQGFVNGQVADYQVAAWAMAVYFQGMTDQETTDLTLAMAHSGAQLDLHDSLPPGTVVVDKHSSGGVGDKTTLAVGPIVAACGLPVGKMSGRGLSFTGGTIDKLESIPGWCAELSDEAFRRQLRDIGLVITGQTVDLAPADKSLYALRDVTGTVPSLPLIASSIMSKKLAAGADAIVLDVKAGRGAFMATVEEARRLAQSMVSIGERSGRRVTALITQMEQPLGAAVGNALEVAEAVATLQGKGPADFQTLVELVAMEMLLIGSDNMTEKSAHTQVSDAIRSGNALAKLRAFVEAQGGDARVVDDPAGLPQAPIRLPVQTKHAGVVAGVDPREVGLTVVDLGGGRRRKGDAIDHAVGVIVHAKVGTTVAAGDELCTIYAASREDAERAAERLHRAWEVVDESCEPLPVVYEKIHSTTNQSGGDVR